MFTTWYETQRETSPDWLQTLHRHPETGFEEVRTAAFVADRLTDLGYSVETGIGGTESSGLCMVSARLPKNRDVVSPSAQSSMPCRCRKRRTWATHPKTLPVSMAAGMTDIWSPH